MGADWRGFQDIDPAVLTRERIVEFLAKVQPEMLLAVVPHGTPKEVAATIKTFVDAGLRVPKISTTARWPASATPPSSAANVVAAEDELLALCGDVR